MKIGILQAGHAPDEMRATTGNYSDLFETLLAGKGLQFQTFDVVDMAFPGSIHDCDGWLITGSKHGAYEDHDFIPPLEVFIRDCFAADIPMVGVCFGHQIIAQALGGTVTKFTGGWAVGRQTYDWQGETVHLNAWHQDQVVALPEGAQVCASNDFCANAAVVYGRTAFTVQAHPEFDGSFIAGLATHRGTGVVPDPLLDTARLHLDTPVDTARLASHIAQFFKERRLA